MRIGRILRPHGVQGAVKVQPLTDDTARFAQLSEAYLEGVDYQPVHVSTAGIGPNEAILKIEGIDTRDGAEKLRGTFVCVDRAHTVTPPPGRYFIVDLIGCAVVSSLGTALGVLTEVLSLPANDVYVVKRPEGGTLMVPALKRLLSEVDVSAKRMVLDAQVLEEVGLFED